MTRFGAPVAAYDSGALVDLRLAATGNAQVYVFLHRDAEASKTHVARELGKHFSAEKASRIVSMAQASGSRKRPPAFRYFPRLGIVLGTVNSAALRPCASRLAVTPN